MTSALENLCGPGKSLRAEPPDAKEFAGLKRSGRKRLAAPAAAARSAEAAHWIYLERRMIEIKTGTMRIFKGSEFIYSASRKNLPPSRMHPQ
ncbi:MAG: hypothetical protein WBM28_16715 [Burkholderiales bacterium]